MSVLQRRNAFFVHVAAGGFFLLLGASATFASWPAQPESLLIIHTNDIHAHLLPYPDPKGEMVGGAHAHGPSAMLRRQRACGVDGVQLLCGPVGAPEPVGHLDEICFVRRGAVSDPHFHVLLFGADALERALVSEIASHKLDGRISLAHRFQFAQ